MANEVSTDTGPGDLLARLRGRNADKIDAARLVEWLRLVNAASARPLDRDALRARVVAVLPLVEDLPASLFTLDSARRLRTSTFPSAAAIRAATAPAMRALNEEIAALQTRTGSVERGTTEAGRWVSYFRRRMAGEVQGMPQANEGTLLEFIRRMSPGAYDQLAGVMAEDFADAKDRAWWSAKIDGVDRMAHPTLRWREANGMLAVLTRPGAHVRQWAIDRLVGILRNAEDDGADTVPQPVSMPVAAAVPSLRHVAEPAFSDRKATEEARASAVESGSIFGDPLPAPPSTKAALTREQLAAAYAAGKTPATQFRAAQLGTTSEDHPDA